MQQEITYQPYQEKMIMHRKWQLVLGLILISVLGCAKTKVQKYQETQSLMGTQVSITVFAENRDKANQAIKAAFRKISELEDILSNYKEDSDISHLNQTQLSKIKVSSTTFEVIKKSIEFGRISNGTFDITVGPILKLWQEAEKKNLLPSSNDLKKAKDRTGYNNIILEPETLEAGFTQPDMSIDLGGIGKGYIVDEAINVLKSHGITQALIDAGGDVYALGNNPERGKWLVGIRNPLNPDEILKNIEISDKAVATSGHYMRFYTIQGKKYSHIIDPRTGWPVKEKVASVTVIAPDATTADALATAISVLGPQAGIKLAESIPGVETLVVTQEAEKLSFIQSSGFPLDKPQ